MAYSNPLVDRINRLCFKNNIPISDFEKELGFSQGLISRWKDTSPSVNNVLKVANRLNVSVDYLLGNTETQSKADDILHDNVIIAIQRLKESMTPTELHKMLNLLKISFPDFHLE